jgi:LysM repeat protein
MGRIISYITFVFLWAAPQTQWANRKNLEDYIQAYKDIAISEMRRTGIPASIKLAQGLLESDLGRSPLAVEANNHFGIKCGGQWQGDVYFKYDDDKDSQGNLIESCFRVFSSVEESYMAHSEFLMDPSKSGRYGFLFQLGSQDYQGWANGLKFSGYATDPKYPSKLIKLIESYKLYEYDEAVVLSEAQHTELAYSDGTKPHSAVISHKTNTGNRESDDKIAHSDKVSHARKGKTYRSSKINDLYVTYSKNGETLKSISRRTGRNVYDLLEFNEGVSSFEAVLEEGEIVFLERKKKAYYGDDTEYYTVKGDETMYDISQMFGIRLESLLVKNNFPDNARPRAGAQISLLKHLSMQETPAYEWIETFDSYVDLGDLR